MTADPGGTYRADNHLWLFTWTNGRVFQAGPSRSMNWYGVTGNGSTTAAGTRADDTDAMNGNAVMYEPGHILTVGGAPAYENSNATRNAYLVDITGPAVSVSKLAPMANARAFANAVALPDGKVMVVGGQNFPRALLGRHVGPHARDLGSGDEDVHADGRNDSAAQLSQRGAAAA